MKLNVLVSVWAFKIPLRERGADCDFLTGMHLNPSEKFRVRDATTICCKRREQKT